MKKIIVFVLILIATILFTSCSTQQRVVYRDCDCPTNRYDYWNRYSWSNPYWGLDYWTWNNWYWRTPPIIVPNNPSRYERRQSIGPRPSRNTQNWSNDVDPMYPRITPGIPSINAEPSQRTTPPSRIQSNPNRNYQPQQQSTPSRTQSPVYRSTTPTTRSRSGNN